jgi:hypothetical protein
MALSCAAGMLVSAPKQIDLFVANCEITAPAFPARPLASTVLIWLSLWTILDSAG